MPYTYSDTMKKPPPIETCYAKLGERIRHLRQMKLMTQDDLATKVGLTRTSVVNIEQGRQRVMLHDIRAFSQALGVPCERFIVSILTDEKEPAKKSFMITALATAKRQRGEMY